MWSASSASVCTFPSCFHVITLILTIIHIPASSDFVQLQADVGFSMSWVCHMLFLHVNWKHMRLCCITCILPALAKADRPSVNVLAAHYSLWGLFCSGFVEMWQLCFSCMWSLGVFSTPDSIVPSRWVRDATLLLPYLLSVRLPSHSTDINSLFCVKIVFKANSDELIPDGGGERWSVSPQTGLK